MQPTASSSRRIPDTKRHDVVKHKAHLFPFLSLICLCLCLCLTCTFVSFWCSNRYTRPCITYSYLSAKVTCPPTRRRERSKRREARKESVLLRERRQRLSPKPIQHNPVAWHLPLKATVIRGYIREQQYRTNQNTATGLLPGLETDGGGWGISPL